MSIEIDLDERKKVLQAEIERSRELLKANFENANLSDYISLPSGAIPGVVKGIIDNPSKTISGADMVSRTLLPQSSLIRKLFSYLSFMKRAYKIITGK